MSIHTVPPLSVALVGNPNSGKSSIFNALTGMHQKVGNFPGVTVEKKVGKCTLSKESTIHIIDLPGTYSLYPKKEDEWVVYDYLLKKENTPDVILFSADATNLKRNLLFCSQIMELNIPIIMVLTMTDIAKRKQIRINFSELERRMGVPVISVNARRGRGIEELKKLIAKVLNKRKIIAKKKSPFIDHDAYAGTYINALRPLFPPHTESYKIVHAAIFPTRHRTEALSKEIQTITQKLAFNKTAVQAEEITQRYQKITRLLRQVVTEPDPLTQKRFTDKLDNLLLHRYWGYIILAFTFFLIFQCIFWIAQYPMDLIESGFSFLEDGLVHILPDYIFSPSISNVFIAKLLLSGISATVVFVPQIMILTGITTFLEDTGYMARVSFLSDSLMRKFGLNGKSLMPLISGMACAVPAIMAARNIENRRERLLTIFTVPFITCSARLPIFVMLTAMTIPEIYFFHFISLQGLVIMGLYIFGFVMSFMVSFVSRFFIKTKEKSIFILELPLYKMPRYRTILMDIFLKTRIFLVDVGKVIILISILLTILFSLVPEKESQRIMTEYAEKVHAHPEQESDYELDKNAALINASYAARIGKFSEPIIQPLGYNWQIGIAVLASFAAREVFIGTLATVYSFEEEQLSDATFLRQRLTEIRTPNGNRIFSLATSFSLLIFYSLAMQCMSTLATVKRETGSWKFAAIQFLFMTTLAYILAYITYNTLKHISI